VLKDHTTPTFDLEPFFMQMNIEAGCIYIYIYIYRSERRKEESGRRMKEPKRRKEVRATDERVEATERTVRATDERDEVTERSQSDG